MNGKPWSEDELDRLRILYPTRRGREVAEALGRSLSGTYGAVTKLGLRKDEAFFRSPASGILQKGETRPGCIATQFRKGQVPANKGLRRPGWAPGRMKETQFRKGVRSGVAATNWRPIGTILSDADGYLRIKVREAKHGVEATGFGNTSVWPLLQRHVWQQQRGPIPAGHVIAFLDGKRKNCAIENLECISRAELARRNQMWTRLPRELAEAIQLNGAIKRKLRELSDGKK